VQSAFAEPQAPPATASALAVELHELSRWLGLGDVVVTGAGDLAPDLTVAVRSAASA
jgi:uncharacterized protein YcaQ